jgi:hypothetical protein
VGMDVYGRKAKDEKGEYFRCNVWWWRPLWKYCEQVVPIICGKVEGAQFNQGEGLDDADSAALASSLRVEIESGRTAEYAKEYKEWRDSLPPRGQCTSCKGTGEYEAMTCLSCGGKGVLCAWDAEYEFNVETVAEFADFLESCGGFEIW